MTIKINEKPIKIEISKAWYTKELTLSRPNALYIFGDNTLRVGMAGQANIRPCYNATGIATKKVPGMADTDFFSDALFLQCCSKITQDIEKIKKRILNDNMFDTIVFPFDGLGTGLSQLPKRAPKVWLFLCEQLLKEFGITTGLDGKLYFNAKDNF